MDSLLSLPGGASFTDHRGQANLSVKMQAGSATEAEYIYVEATCDSLQLKCEEYRRTVSSLRRSLDEQSSSMNRLMAEEACTDRRVDKPPNMALALALALVLVLELCFAYWLFRQR